MKRASAATASRPKNGAGRGVRRAANRSIPGKHATNRSIPGGDVTQKQPGNIEENSMRGNRKQSATGGGGPQGPPERAEEIRLSSAGTPERRARAKNGAGHATKLGDAGAKCPFYQKRMPTCIFCESPVPKTTVKIQFRLEADMKRHYSTYCCGRYDACEMYSAVMARYEDEEE